MATARLRELGQLSPEHTVLMVCDLQEKFAPSIARFWAIVNNAERLMKESQGFSVNFGHFNLFKRLRESRAGSNHQSDYSWDPP